MNLKAGRIRMLFVADQIPVELQSVVEFLNRQMEQAEVLAVEVKQYRGKDGQPVTLVPRVIGQITDKPAGRNARTWDENRFFAELEAKRGLEETRVARRLFDWSKKNVTSIVWGKGARDGQLTPVLDVGGKGYQFMCVWTYGLVQMQFGYLQARSPLEPLEKRLELIAQLNQIEGVNISTDAASKYPSIPLAALTSEQALTAFLRAIAWAIDSVERQAKA